MAVTLTPNKASVVEDKLRQQRSTASNGILQFLLSNFENTQTCDQNWSKCIDKFIHLKPSKKISNNYKLLGIWECQKSWIYYQNVCARRLTLCDSVLNYLCIVLQAPHGDCSSYIGVFVDVYGPI